MVVGLPQVHKVLCPLRQPENLLNGIALNDPPPLTEYPSEEAESNDEDDVDERLLTIPITPLLLISLNGVFMLLVDPSLLNEAILFLSASGEGSSLSCSSWCSAPLALAPFASVSVVAVVDGAQLGGQDVLHSSPRRRRLLCHCCLLLLAADPVRREEKRSEDERKIKKEVGNGKRLEEMRLEDVVGEADRLKSASEVR
ncbi:hypothetical protein AKJ16_DCAP14212 [Drosera capensis]